VYPVDSSEAPYRFEGHAGYSVVALYPLINDGHWGNVSEVGTEILDRLESLESPYLIVDLSPLDYMGSAQVALLVRVWKALKKSQRRMVVQCPGQMVREVLTIAGLKDLWEVVETRGEALEKFGIREARGQHGALAGPIFSIVALLGAGVALGLQLAGTLISGTLWVEFGLVAAALVAGMVTVVRERGFWRGVGAGVIVASVAMCGLSAAKWNRPAAEDGLDASQPPASEAGAVPPPSPENVALQPTP
jgi:anti-anti-sigma factor